MESNERKCTMSNNQLVTQKNEIRRSQLALRKALPKDHVMTYSQQINDKLIHFFQHHRPKVVHAYWPMKGEIDIRSVVEWLINNDTVVLLPKVIDSVTMIPVVYESGKPLVEGVFGTLHPNSDLQYQGPIDAFIIPGLAFDTQKNRLGYGAGYFDRFLNNHPTALKIAVALPFQLIQHLPAEAHDVPMDLIVAPE